MTTSGEHLPLIGSDELRHALGHFASGVVVVTGVDDQGPAGLTCQSFMSLSLDPPLIALAPSRASRSWPRIAATGAFCVNILSEDQEELGRTFAVSGGDKFADVAWTEASTGSPRLEGVLAWVDCRLHDVHDGGDHLLVVGRIVELGTDTGDPLVFHRSGFGGFRG